AVDSGEVWLDGRDVTTLPPDARARAGLTRSFQKNNLFTDLTVRDNLALAIAPKILLLDEPTAGMSPDETRAMTALIASLPRDIALLVIEHDMEVVFNIAERIIVLDYGSVLIEGTPEEVRASDAVRRRYLGEKRR